jgi:menaquinone-dependent protoporphyrinogen oxidase
MSSKILVTYATTSGSTQEVAEAIAAELRSAGLSVDLQPAKAVRSLADYSAVVLGAPLYMFHLHADARRFLARFQNDLQTRPCAVFAGGPFDPADEKTWRDVRQNFDQELAKFAWLKPVSTLVIGGKFDPTRLRFPYNLIPALKKMPASDLRDWDAIRAWANELAGQFQPVTV